MKNSISHKSLRRYCVCLKVSILFILLLPVSASLQAADNLYWTCKGDGLFIDSWFNSNRLCWSKTSYNGVALYFGPSDGDSIFFSGYPIGGVRWKTNERKQKERPSDF